MKKKFFALAIIVVLTLALAPTVFATTNEPPATPLPGPYYMEFSGRVIEINPYHNVDGSESGKLFVLAQGAEAGMLMNFVVDEQTVMLTEGEIKLGANIVGFYLGNMPMIMIYPPQAHAALLAVNPPEGQNVKAALFDENLTSDDNDLKLNIGENTEIVLQNGEPAPAGLDLSNRRLVVFYTVSTRSIPAQTTPLRVIVLYEEPVPVQETPPEVDMADNMPLSVENVLLLDAPPVYIHESGAVMIPLRAVAEALDYEVSWMDGVVSLNGKAILAIGQSTYTEGDMPVKLTVAAELHNGVTYVPLNFFTQVLKLNNAYVLEGQVFIDNGEKME